LDADAIGFAIALPAILLGAGGLAWRLHRMPGQVP
jgi:hypothetical protein